MTQRLLVVDDDPQIVRLLRATLEQAGYRVFVAYNGKAIQQSCAKGGQS
jgi:DNA-binding response OmpR family regulator